MPFPVSTYGGRIVLLFKDLAPAQQADYAKVRPEMSPSVIFSRRLQGTE